MLKQQRFIRILLLLLFISGSGSRVHAEENQEYWQDLSTHVLDSYERSFSEEVSEAVAKAVLYGNKASGDGTISVTNFVEFCDPFNESRCFAVALYSVGPDMNRNQYLAWLLKTDPNPTYFKIWERHAGGGVCCSRASLAVVWPFFNIQKSGWSSPCLYSATSSGGAGQNVEMRLYCHRTDSIYPQVLWEYTADYWGESLAQAFRKSIVTFKDMIMIRSMR